MAKVKLTESKLRKLIRESLLLEEARKVIEESMIAPQAIKKVWKHSGQDGTAYIVQGDNGRFYDVYPSYNDSYLVDSDCDEFINKICKKIEQSFHNHGIPCNVYPYNWEGEGEVIVEIRDGMSDNKFNDDFAEMLKVWMKNKGFSFKEYDDMYRAYHFTYDNYSDDISVERIEKMLNGYVDCTDLVERNARMAGISSTLQLFKSLDSLSRG